MSEPMEATEQSHVESADSNQVEQKDPEKAAENMEVSDVGTIEKPIVLGDSDYEEEAEEVQESDGSGDLVIDEGSDDKGNEEESRELDSTIYLKRIYDKLLTAEDQNRCLEQRMEKMENSLEEKSKANEELRKVSEETLRRATHYLEESSQLINSQMEKLEKWEKKQEKKEEEVRKLLRNMEKKNNESMEDMIKNELETMKEYYDERQVQGITKIEEMRESLRVMTEKTESMSEEFSLKTKKTRCIFCHHSNHKSDACDRYRSLEQRIGRLIDDDMCKKCLKPESEHNPKCPEEGIVCSECKNEYLPGSKSANHNSLLCADSKARERQRNRRAQSRRRSRSRSPH